jgi:hypothetical protein
MNMPIPPLSRPGPALETVLTETLYAITFTSGAPQPSANPWNVALVCGASLEEGQEEYPPRGPLQGSVVGPNGLLLYITKLTAATPKVVVMVGISPVPPEWRRFVMVARCSLPHGVAPANPGDMWAATLVARVDGTLHPNAMNDVNGDHVGATHQVVGGDTPQVQLGVGRGPDILPAATNSATQFVSVDTAYPSGRGFDFTLQTSIDCDENCGYSSLSTPGFVWEGSQQWDRSHAYGINWTFPFTSASVETQRSPLTMIGVALAMPMGMGTPWVIVKELAIYR